MIAPYSITTIVINSDAPLTQQEAWRQQHFVAASNLGNAADSIDADNDGESNLYEFATGQNPFDATRVAPSVIKNGANLEFIHTRSRAAVLDGLTFIVEWSDTLAPGSWNTLGVTESTVEQNDTLQSRLALVPKGATGSRFVRLRVAP